jgi:hypothetical protein
MEKTETEEPIENINSGTWKYFYGHYLLVILYVCVFATVIYFIPNEFSIAIMLVIGFFWYIVVYGKIKTEFTQEFGKSIGFTYEKNASAQTALGKLFGTGHSQILLDVLSGVYQKTPMRIFTLRFTVGYGKNSHTYSYTVFEAILNNTVPDILLFSKAHMNAISDWFSNDETIELEGNFNKYFKLRVPKGYEQEAYQIFAPDVMADLIDKAQNVSFEFVGNRLYIYATKTITRRDDMQSIFSLSDYLTNLFDKNIPNSSV